MSNYAYNILISRIDEGGEQQILLERDITADEAIDAILDSKLRSHEIEMQNLEAVHALDVATEPEPTHPVPYEIPAPKEKTAAGSYERKLSYNLEAVQDDVTAGMSVLDIAAKHKIQKQIVYNIRAKMKKAGELKPEQELEDEEEEPSEAEAMNNELVNCKSNDEKVRVMLRHGMTSSDVYKKMHDYMTEREFTDAVEDYWRTEPTGTKPQ